MAGARSIILAAHPGARSISISRIDPAGIALAVGADRGIRRNTHIGGLNHPAQPRPGAIHFGRRICTAYQQRGAIAQRQRCRNTQDMAASQTQRRPIRRQSIHRAGSVNIHRTPRDDVHRAEMMNAQYRYRTIADQQACALIQIIGFLNRRVLCKYHRLRKIHGGKKRQHHGERPHQNARPHHSNLLQEDDQPPLCTPPPLYSDVTCLSLPRPP